MSNSKSAISEIKKLMVQFGFLSVEPTLLDFKLEDDTILQAEAIEVGKEIFKINELFEKVTLEDGTYTLNDFSIEVSEGKISNVKEMFVSGKLKDGTDVSATGKGFEVGGKLFVIKDGTSLPAPDGDHELEDGSKVTVKDGEIVSVVTPAEEKGPGEETETPAEEGAESPAEEGAEPASPVDKETTKADAKLNPQHYDEMYNMLKEFVTKCGAKMAEMEGQYSSLQNEFEAFKKEPAGSKIKYSKSDAFSKVDDEVDARLFNILEMRKNKK
ncbi:hypothetical protein UFOVP187_5 [uncultured Caudovirales phage]|uniref:Uncharacterized protein n=1 Tax=uncultured Caudovirales phage TaxID=2100421 RepID=A0A6J7WIF1_9CAUD|nr:hypothetical protein UFOVP187_5 [uncultured Caudovirales phage]